MRFGAQLQHHHWIPLPWWTLLSWWICDLGLDSRHVGRRRPTVRCRLYRAIVGRWFRPWSYYRGLRATLA